MFDDIGAKIKNVAVTVTWIGIIFSCISGIVMMCSNEDLILPGFLTMIGGSLASWLSSLTLYGFGQLIENSDILVKQGKRTILLLNNQNINTSAPTTNNAEINSSTTNNSPKHTFRCSACGNMISEDVCPICKYDNSVTPGKDVNAEDLVSTDKDTIICPICKYEQPSSRKVCWHCGVKFENNN